ncbi:MAG: hypothetical protein COX62_06605 [Deltaproteobacteria bacterium CG_4_10_14_0_2_um_filter_43_8]|nr:MAG: hypothetical protein COV43_01985 [Deltaproteobacteria bacterium CG11_big_fil_rev_8_21_14_0_20_42_23]PJA19485.1 MAG: hypothetical protein COX62_06605 [Deltaproteobacteria bacterium CG_4_10_14_0_2_um_filter_43_8]PJC63883.1 MAG: hypothetical protein CO021_07165 [Deltaproteobacteria bacterium CG_4_9_14_0_2_um_filter_42_21]
MNAEEVISFLNLEPLPEEGGFYRETYRAKSSIPVNVLPQHNGARTYSTCIYYLLTPSEFSALHRLPQDEIFHFYLGDPVNMIQIDDAGTLKEITLGHHLENGQSVQVLAPGNVWQGTRLNAGGKWALLGTTVAPGFEFADFEVLSRSELLRQFPQHKEKALPYTR